ncbi:TatD family hydrolase [Mycoplasmopsis verecunda]|uniref:TatD DNase family protein n=1 Tax=Mycoplasmopsis verecunda TaxID=171291 RepID=A0A1T4KYI7_9BACT|nr:TatD family hydrolase [Mycoplasmopsis verecunda]WPB54355.1 TatD family hydrolase [Mycoplasmopsis verecunda]SJZ47524.1 TatD DNase family protein [Mycoplasmopsis verecunda]
MSKKRNKFVDAHNHLSINYYKNEDIIDMICEQAIANRIEFFIVNGGHPEENVEVLQLAQKYHPLIKPCIGIHPESGIDGDDYKRIENLIDDSVVGIGEIGLDYYYPDGPSRENQIASMKNQIILANNHNLPVVIHIRDKDDCYLAYQDVYEMLLEFPKIKCMLHTFAGNLQWAKKFMEFENLYFSFSGSVTYGTTNKTREVIQFLPLERILTETDSPYLRVHPYTGEMNEPNSVLFVAYYIAGLKNVGMDKFADRVNRNLRNLFNLKDEN